MRHLVRDVKAAAILLAFMVLAGWTITGAQAQDQAPPPQQQDQGPPQQDQAPPSFAPDQLDKMVSRIALYPDPLLAQVLAAATFPDQISDAAKWADEHHYLRGDDLAHAIDEDHLPWDASVQALLPFPSVLDTMASDINWTSDLGNAFLAQKQDVMDAVQRMRQKAKDYGYLRSNAQVVVGGGGPYITIDPVDAAYVYVPAYDPLIVFGPPRPGFFVGGAIGWGFGINLGIAFRPWGWGFTRFDWGGHALYFHGAPWGRTWVNRRAYVHNYQGFHRYEPGRRVEGHPLIRRDEGERRAAHEGHARPEEHHRR